MSNLPPLMTTAEVAKKCGVAAKTVTRWATNGTLPPVKKLEGLRGAYLFSRAEVERLKAERAA